jgi:hypothetical protein
MEEGERENDKGCRERPNLGGGAWERAAPMAYGRLVLFWKRGGWLANLLRRPAGNNTRRGKTGKRRGNGGRTEIQ